MKRFLLLLLVAAMSLMMFPVSSFAIEPENAEFEEFLQGIGWDKQDYLDYLESKEWFLEDFEYVDELGTPLSEEGVQAVLLEFELSREELNSLLVENGDIEEGQDAIDAWFLFNEDLQSSVDYYINGWEGTPIDDENLQQLLEDYGFESKEALEEFLVENGDSLENYEYIEDLDYVVYFYTNGDEELDEVYSLFTDIGFTDEELERFFLHLETLDFEDPAFLESLLALSERMMAFEDFEVADELTAEQIAELLDIFTEMLNLVQVDTKYFLVKDGEKQSVSFETLMTMETTNGYDLLIELYNKQGEFLLDVLFTAEMFGSEIIKETGEDIKEATEIVSEKPPVKAKPPVHTVKGGKLPTTASDYLSNTVAGFALVLVGMLLFRRVRVKGN